MGTQAEQDSDLDLRQISRPMDFSTEEKDVLEQYGLTRLYFLCAEHDNRISQEAIKNYNHKTYSTTVDGIELVLEENAIAKDFDLLQEEKPKCRSLEQAS